MKYGIPFTRPFTSPFGAPFFGIGSIGPQEPTGFVAKYTAYLVDNFTLVTGDSINVWQDESVNSNDLTQGTSANQPKLVEDNTLTQFTASNQPTFQKDKQVTQDTLANMPTYDATEGALVFDGVNALEGIPQQTTDFTVEVKIKWVGSLVFQRDVLTGDVSLFRIANTTRWQIRSDQSNVYNFDGFDTFAGEVLKITKNGSMLSVDDGSFSVSIDIGTDTINYNTIGSIFAYNGNYYYYKQWNSAVSTGTPDFELDGSDPTTMLNDSDAQPSNGDSVRLWHDPSAVDVMAFDADDTMKGLPTQGSDFTYKLYITEPPASTNSRYLYRTGSNTSFIINTTFNWIQVVDDLGSALNFTSVNFSGKEFIEVTKDGNNLTISNGVDSQTQDVSSYTLVDHIDQLGGNNQSNFDLKKLEFWNSADSSGAPDFTLTPDPTKLRTSANTNPVLGEDVAKWYADQFSAYRDSRVVFDATDDNMSGLPALTGDWSYMIDTSINTLGTTKYLLEQTAGSSAILALADDLMYLRDTTGANDIALTSYTLTTGRTQFGFVRSGDDLLYYVNGVLKETVDVTGRTFDFGTVGKSATSADMDTKQIIPFNKALTQTEIQYYSYLRSETGDILTDEQGNPLLPSGSTIYPVNSATLNGTSQALTITNGNSSIEPSSTDFSMGAWVKGSDTTTTQMIFNRYDAGATLGFDTYIQTSKVIFRIESSGSDYSSYSIPATALIDGNLNHLTCNWNQSTQDFTVHVNDSEVTTTLITKLGTVQLDFTDHALSFGYRESTANLFFNGYMSFGYWKNSAITNTERTKLYGSGVPPCFEDLSFSLDGAWNLSTRTGDSDPTTDKMDNGNNLTEIGSPTYTDQGLTVECNP
jgi:hypothetical protein